MSWERFKKHYLSIPELGFSLDISRMNFADDYLPKMEEKIQSAYVSMDELEKGSIANPDEGRMVGHYWLRNSSIAPDATIAKEIDAAVASIQSFVSDVHSGKVSGKEGQFKNVLVIGIGGSALGPQFVSQALGDPAMDKLTPYFLDNTDPDGMDLVFSQLKGQLGQTISVVISKSGGTPETRNGMLEAEKAYREAGLDFAKHAVAITGEGSKLDHYAVEKGFVTRFPMWDWVGGRTSELATVGLVPAALQGIDITGMLRGAAAMDKATRSKDTHRNPAALLALMWYYATDGKGSKDMVILPYKDRLMLFSKYLQQLVMESLGKELDLAGNVVNQGIAVYGNKGSTDQHAYVQQLRDGVLNFFATFIEVLQDRKGSSMEVEAGATSGDFLSGFFLGTRSALHDNGRESITITVDTVSPEVVGMLIALYERAVGLYATLVGINAYHQPGVEAGKKAAAGFLDLNRNICEFLKSNPGKRFTAEALAVELRLEKQTEFVFKLLNHLAANPDRKVIRTPAADVCQSEFHYKN